MGCALVAVSACMVGTEALANPVQMNQARAVQVPDTYHVQITWACVVPLPGISAMGGMCSRPSGVSHEGTALIWTGPVTVEASGGSGASESLATQACHCDAEPGVHLYTFTYGENGRRAGPEDIEVSVVDPPPGPPEALPEPDPDVVIYAFEEPEPPWPQGIDCAQWCADNPPAPGEMANADRTAADGASHSRGVPDASVKTIGDPQSGGCSVGSRCAAPLATAMVVLLLLLGIAAIRFCTFEPTLLR